MIDTISLITTRQVPGVEDIVGFASGRIRDHAPPSGRPEARGAPRTRTRRTPRYFSSRDRVRPSLYLRITADPAARLDDLVHTVKTHVRHAIHASTGLHLDRVRVTVVDRPTAQRQCTLRRRSAPDRPGHVYPEHQPAADTPTPDAPLSDETMVELLIEEAAATPGVAYVADLHLLPDIDKGAAILRVYVTLGSAVPRVVRRLRKRLDACLIRHGRPALAALHIDIVGIRIGRVDA